MFRQIPAGRRVVAAPRASADPVLHRLRACVLGHASWGMRLGARVLGHASWGMRLGACGAAFATRCPGRPAAPLMPFERLNLRARTGVPRPNSRPWRIDAVLTRGPGRLSSSISSRTALAAGGLSNAVAARTAYRASWVACGAGCAARSTCSTTAAAAPTPLRQRTGTECECRHT